MTTNSGDDRTGQRPDIAWTPRQKEVLDLLARGYGNAQLADALGISLDGAKWHVREIMAILAVDSREDAADYWRARNGLHTRLRRGIATALAGAASRWVTVLAAVGGLAAFVAAVVLLGSGDEPTQPESPTEAPTVVSGATPETEYRCPFDAPEVCAFAFETAAAFQPPDYGLSRLLEGSPWAAPEYERVLANRVEGAFRSFDRNGVPIENTGDIELVSMGCPIHGDFARCEPGFVLTFADFDAALSQGITPTDILVLVFENRGDGTPPVLTGPLDSGDLPGIPTAILGGDTPCNLLGLETRIPQCNGLLYRSTLIAPPDPSTIAGLAVRELVASDPAPLPDGIALYFNPTCYGCDGGISTFRASADDGVLSIKELGPLPPGSARGSGDPYYMARTIDTDGRRIAMGVCDQFYCGGIGDAEPGASATLWISEDSGATWTNHGELPVGSDFRGFVGDQIMVSSWDDATRTRTNWLYPSGEPWPKPPAAAEDDRPVIRWESPAGEVFWTQTEGDLLDARVLDDTGAVLINLIDLAYRTQLDAIGSDGTFYFRAAPIERGDNALQSRVVALNGSGEPVAAFDWAWGDVRLTSPIAPGVFIGNALFGPYPEPFGAAVNFRPAIIDFNKGTVSPIAGLPPDPASGIGGYAFTIVAIVDEAAP